MSKRCSGDWLIADCKVAWGRIKMKTCLRDRITLHCYCNNIIYFPIKAFQIMPTYPNLTRKTNFEQLSSGEKVFKHKRKNR